MTQAETARILSIISAYWPSFPHQGELTVRAWHALLADIPYELAHDAVVLLAATRPFPPAISELLDAIAELSLSPADRLSPAEAWGMVVREVRRVGSYGIPSLPDPVARAVQIVGWREICTSEHVDVVRAQFMRVYEQLRQRRYREAALPPALARRLAPSLDAPGAAPRAIGSVLSRSVETSAKEG